MSKLVSDEQAITLYEEDKALGRRLKNGAKPIKKLNTTHRRLIGLILQGYTGNEMAVMLGLTPSRISILRHDPMIEEIINTQLDNCDAELAALMPKAVAALSKGLDSADNNHALKSVDMLFKTQGKFKDQFTETEKKITAEDVARQIIEVKGEARITLETGTRTVIKENPDAL